MNKLCSVILICCVPLNSILLIQKQQHLFILFVLKGQSVLYNVPLFKQRLFELMASKDSYF